MTGASNYIQPTLQPAQVPAPALPSIQTPQVTIGKIDYQPDAQVQPLPPGATMQQGMAAANAAASFANQNYQTSTLTQRGILSAASGLENGLSIQSPDKVSGYAPGHDYGFTTERGVDIAYGSGLNKEAIKRIVDDVPIPDNRMPETIIVGVRDAIEEKSSAPAPFNSLDGVSYPSDKEKGFIEVRVVDGKGTLFPLATTKEKAEATINTLNHELGHYATYGKPETKEGFWETIAKDPLTAIPIAMSLNYKPEQLASEVAATRYAQSHTLNRPMSLNVSVPGMKPPQETPSVVQMLNPGRAGEAFAKSVGAMVTPRISEKPISIAPGKSGQAFATSIGNAIASREPMPQIKIPQMVAGRSNEAYATTVGRAMQNMQVPKLELAPGRAGTAYAAAVGRAMEVAPIMGTKYGTELGLPKVVSSEIKQGNVLSKLIPRMNSTQR